LDSIVQPKDQVVVITVVKEVERDEDALEMTRTIQTMVDGLFAKQRIRDVSLLISVKTGDAGAILVQEAEQLAADGVILGSRGLSTVKRLFVGSVSSYVVHHSTRPVIIVPPSVASESFL